MLTVRYDRLGLRPGEQLLDLGSGGGRHAFEALRRGAVVTALDTDSAALKDARALIAAVEAEERDGAGRGGTGAAIAGDARGLPFSDQVFDRIIAAEVLEHIPEDRQVIAELARVLRPGGTMAVTVPRWWPELLTWAISDDYHNVPGGHMRIYRRSALVDRLRGAGLECYGTHHAHALHSPYWWLRSVVGVRDEAHPLVRAYHRLLVWDITAHTPFTPRSRGHAQPGAREELGRVRQEAGTRPGAIVRGLPGSDATGPLSAVEVSDTAVWIASVQLPTGMIPWFPGGHADPWNHIESAMALVLAGRRQEAERAFAWLAASQLPDGTWCRYYLAEGVEDPRRDPNVGVYVATGAWWHYLCTRDLGLLEDMWPVVEGAVGFVLRLQQPGGEVLWSMDPDGHRSGYALLTSTSSIHHSLRCAVAIAECLGLERPEWELAADRMVEAIVHRPGRFAPKERWAMDWYYPVLSGAVSGEPACQRIDGRWSEFVLEGVGVRCVADQPWVTAAETAECAMALEAIGMRDRAIALLDWTRHMRDDDGAYWTGCVHPECVRYPGGERSTYTAAAVMLADHALYGYGESAGLFRGETLPTVVDVAGVAEPLGEG